MSDSSESTTPVALWMTLFVVLGAPFVYLIWDFINDALSGRFEPVTTGLAVVGAIGLLGVLRFVAARVLVWESGAAGNDRPPEASK